MKYNSQPQNMVDNRLLLMVSIGTLQQYRQSNAVTFLFYPWKMRNSKYSERLATPVSSALYHVTQSELT
jgi:hypothetical protein